MYTMTIINLKIAAFLELKVLGALLPTHIPEQSINASVNWVMISQNHGRREAAAAAERNS